MYIYYIQYVYIYTEYIYIYSVYIYKYNIGGAPKKVVPQNHWFQYENGVILDDLGYAYFRTPLYMCIYYTHTHINERNNWINKQTNTQTDKQTNKQKQPTKQTNKQINK